MMRTIISADPDSVDEAKTEALLLEIAEKRVWHPRGYNFLRRPDRRASRFSAMEDLYFPKTRKMAAPQTQSQPTTTKTEF